MLENIRPSKHKLYQAACLLEDISELHQRDFEELNECPGCHSNEKEFAFKKYSLIFNRCTKCGTVYMSPRPTQESMNEYYKTSRNYEYWAKYLFPSSKLARAEQICKPSINRIRDTLDGQFQLKDLDALEVGPGFGIFAEQCLKEKLFNSLDVVEPTPALAKECKKNNLSVFPVHIEDFQSSKKYGIILAFEVIEHLHSPDNFLNKCRNLLNSDGLIVLSCPNGKGFDTECLGALSPSVDNEHVQLFSPEGINWLMERNKFEIISISTPGKMDVEIVKENIEENPGRLSCEEALLRRLAEHDQDTESLQAEIADRGESGHMWIFAKKL